MAYRAIKAATRPVRPTMGPAISMCAAAPVAEAAAPLLLAAVVVAVEVVAEPDPEARAATG